MAAVTINDFNFSAGRLHGTAAMTLPGTFIWSGGEWRGNGTATFTNTANVTFNGGGRSIFAGRNLDQQWRHYMDQRRSCFRRRRNIYQ
ncbi:MAG: hypothetical protein V9E88_09460 [Ferruginibacter sp.]